MFCYYFGIFYYTLGRNETERQYLFSFFLGLFQPILALNEAILTFFNFLIFFCNFFGILNYASGRDGMKLLFLFSHFLGIFEKILAWNDTIMVFFSFFFLIFLLFFLEFSITRWIGTKQNDNSYFLSFSTFCNVLWL